jgi:hypothetical protein
VSNIVVVTFTEPSKAYQAFTTVKELGASGRLALRLAAIVERKANGDPVVHDTTDTMTILGVPNGMVGRLVDGLMGTDEPAAIAANIAPGTTGLIIEADEYAVEVIDDAMGPLGGTVYRQETDYVKDELKTEEDARHAAEKQAKKQERDEHKRQHERERAEKHNERVDHAEHWLEGQKEPVPPQAAGAATATAQK